MTAPETQQDRTVRLALTAGQLRVELREARARLERVESLCVKWERTPDFWPGRDLRAALRGDA